MKTVVFAFIALAVALTYAADADGPCDPNGDGMPDCSKVLTDSGDVHFRDYWDPVHYWVCPQGGGAAVLTQCPQTELYNSSTKTCVSWAYWEWVRPCPDVVENATLQIKQKLSLVTKTDYASQL